MVNRLPICHLVRGQLNKHSEWIIIHYYTGLIAVSYLQWIAYDIWSLLPMLSGWVLYKQFGCLFFSLLLVFASEKCSQSYFSFLQICLSFNTYSLADSVLKNLLCAGKIVLHTWNEDDYISYDRMLHIPSKE